MAKENEVLYASRLTEDGRRHAVEKPFSDGKRGVLLQQFGLVLDQLPPPPARVLDLGCGTGWTTEFLDRSGYHVTGVDIAQDMIDLARSHPLRRDIEFLALDYESLGQLGEYDAAIFFDCLHHAEDVESALRSVYHVLRPGGTVVLNEPGAGHHAAEHSVHAVEEFGVTEQDLPPSRIIAIATAIGFSDNTVLPDPERVYGALATQDLDHRTPRRGPKSYLRGLRSLAVAHLLGSTTRSLDRSGDLFATQRATTAVIERSTTDGAVTVLVK